MMIDLFFINAPSHIRPGGAKRFGNIMLTRMPELHDIMVNKWEECGKASFDDGFDPRSVDRFDHNDPIKGMTQLTNKYKEWIQRQIHFGCETQRNKKHYVSHLFFLNPKYKMYSS